MFRKECSFHSSDAPRSLAKSAPPQGENIAPSDCQSAYTGTVDIVPGSHAATLYGAESTVEDYRCNYGVNPACHLALTQAGLRLTGFGEDGAPDEIGPGAATPAARRVCRGRARRRVEAMVGEYRSRQRLIRYRT